MINVDLMSPDLPYYVSFYYSKLEPKLRYRVDSYIVTTYSDLGIIYNLQRNNINVGDTLYGYFYDHENKNVVGRYVDVYAVVEFICYDFIKVNIDGLIYDVYDVFCIKCYV